MADAPITLATIETALATLPDPESGRDLGRMEQIHDVAVKGNRIDVTLGLTTWSGLLWEETRQEAERLLRAGLPEGFDVHIRIEEHSRPPERLGEIGLTAKSVIAVGSGKGGVGKST